MNTRAHTLYQTEKNNIQQLTQEQQQKNKKPHNNAQCFCDGFRPPRVSFLFLHTYALIIIYKKCWPICIRRHYLFFFFILVFVCPVDSGYFTLLLLLFQLQSLSRFHCAHLVEDTQTHTRKKKRKKITHTTNKHIANKNVFMLLYNG